MIEKPEERIAIPLVEEEAVVTKRERITGRVRVAKRVVEETAAIDEPLMHQSVEVERVPVGRWVDGPLPEREEGDRLIVPVVEEVLVVEKRYRLVEEVHLIRRRMEERHREEVTLRHEEATVSREDSSD